MLTEAYLTANYNSELFCFWLESRAAHKCFTIDPDFQPHKFTAHDFHFVFTLSPFSEWSFSSPSVVLKTMLYLLKEAKASARGYMACHISSWLLQNLRNVQGNISAYWPFILNLDTRRFVNKYLLAWHLLRDFKTNPPCRLAWHLLLERIFLCQQPRYIVNPWTRIDSRWRPWEAEFETHYKSNSQSVREVSSDKVTVVARGWSNNSFRFEIVRRKEQETSPLTFLTPLSTTMICSVCD